MRKYMSGITFTEDVEGLQTGEKLDKSLENINERLDSIQNSPSSGTSSPATETTDGLMSSKDKRKLDNIDEYANYYIHPDFHPASIIDGLAAVATSGSYNDLSDKPSIPKLIDAVDSTSVDEAPTANALRLIYEFTASVQKNSAEKTFDSMLEQPDIAMITAFTPDSKKIESIKCKSTNNLIATRVTTYSAETDSAAKKVDIYYYKEDGVTIEKHIAITVTFNEDGSITYDTV